MATRSAADVGIDKIGVVTSTPINYNLSYDELFEHEVSNNEGIVATKKGDCFTISTGARSGRVTACRAARVAPWQFCAVAPLARCACATVKRNTRHAIMRPARYAGCAGVLSVVV